MSINVSHGQTISGIVVKNGDVLRVSSGGTVIATQDFGDTQIDQGAHASATTVFSGGQSQNAGRETGTIVSAGGYNIVVDGGVDIHTTDAGFMEVYGATALLTTVTSGGVLEAFGFNGSGIVTVSATTVAHDGSLILSGGSSVNAVLKGGIETLIGGGRDSGATVDRGGLLFVANGSATNITVAAGGATVLATTDGFNAVSASHVTVASGGILAVIGQVATSDITLASGAQLVSTGVLLVASSGAIAAPTLFSHTVRAGESEYVLSGGVATGAIIAGGSQTIEADGTAAATMVTAGGMVSLVGGTLDRATLGSGGSLSGSGATSNLLVAGGSATYSGTAMHDTVASGVFHVSGSATGTVISGGSATLGGVVSATVVDGGSVALGGFEPFFTGHVTDTTVTGGTVTLYGSSAADTRISGGFVYTSAATTSDTKIFNGGVLVQDKPSGSFNPPPIVVTDTVVESGGVLMLEEAPTSVDANTLNTTIEIGGMIDFATLGYVSGATADVKDHTLVVSGSKTARLGLVGGYAHVQFLTESDGSGGTLVVAQPLGATVPLAQDVGSAGAEAIARDLTPPAIQPAAPQPGGWPTHLPAPDGAACLPVESWHATLALLPHTT